MSCSSRYPTNRCQRDVPSQGTSFQFTDTIGSVFRHSRHAAIERGAGGAWFSRAELMLHDDPLVRLGWRFDTILQMISQRRQLRFDRVSAAGPRGKRPGVTAENDFVSDHVQMSAHCGPRLLSIASWSRAATPSGTGRSALPAARRSRASSCAENTRSSYLICAVEGSDIRLPNRCVCDMIEFLSYGDRASKPIFPVFACMLHRINSFLHIVVRSSKDNIGQIL